jgi:hypothetical protein
VEAGDTKDLAKAGEGLGGVEVCVGKWKSWLDIWARRLGSNSESGRLWCGGRSRDADFFKVACNNKVLGARRCLDTRLGTCLKHGDCCSRGFEEDLVKGLGIFFRDELGRRIRLL